MCVLLVEDEDLLRMILTEIMMDAGLDVVDTPSGENALLLSKAAPSPQLIVSDINLGSGMTGFEFVTLARCRWPAVPVLMMSGLTPNFNNRHCGRGERFIAKPFSLETFMHNVTDLASALEA